MATTTDSPSSPQIPGNGESINSPLFQWKNLSSAWAQVLWGKLESISAVHHHQTPMKHGRSWEGVAPEFDVAWLKVRRSTWLPARRCHVWAFFFFFTRIPTNSARIGLYQPNRVVSVGNQNKLKRLKQAEICLESCRNSQNWLWMRPKHPKSVIPQFYSKYLLHLLCFLFCFLFLAFFFLCFVNQGIVMCFLRIF